jgi:hypothetical protein
MIEFAAEIDDFHAVCLLVGTLRSSLAQHMPR